MIIIACATNDGENFIKEHFGSADKYLIFEFDEKKYYSTKEKNYKLYKIVNNIPFEEKRDGDPEKANVISKLLKPLGVKVLINKAMGPNIVRMRKQFACVISNINNIKESLQKLDIDSILEEIKRPEGKDRKVIYIK